MKFYITLLLAAATSTNAFIPSHHNRIISTSTSIQSSRQCPTLLYMSSTESKSTTTSASSEQTDANNNFPPILEELRNIAMKLHTREQSPKEGKAESPAKPVAPYVPTHADYLQFLVDSNAVYQVLEQIVNTNDKLAVFRNTGIERTQQLEKDIEYMCTKYDLQRPKIGNAGSMYVEELQNKVQSDDDIPEFMCHYYNYYFAHLAGGRMIGKQMSKLLLNGETLEFYKVCMHQCVHVYFYCYLFIYHLSKKIHKQQLTYQT